jgi:glycosyltransferase involved in cell wall biosynthesis
VRHDELRLADSAGGGAAQAPTPLRIIHCFRSPVGGLFRHVADLVEAQHQAGHQIGIICDSSTGSGREINVFARLEPWLGLGLLRVPMRREIGPSDLTATWRLARRIRSLKPDVLHGHGAKGGAYARTIGTILRATGSRVARIYTPHGGSLHYDKSSLGGRVYLGSERALARMTDAFIFVSDFERDAFIAKVGKSKRPMVVVRNGLRPEEFEPVRPGTNVRDFLFIGELRDLKGPDVFIGAVALLRSRKGRAPTAVIVGSGPDEQKYRTVVSELDLADDVEFRGAMPARDALRLTRTMVVPSRAESMPYIVLETIAAGIPIVATRVGGIPEIFGADSDRLVPPGNAAALADAMAAVTANMEAAQTAAAALKQRIRAEFSVRAMGAAIEGVYRTVTVR